MNLLVDTHAFLWWMTNDPRLSPKAHRLVADPANRIHLSAAAAWEISTKHRIGKLPEAGRVLPRFMAAIAEAMIEPLPVSLSSTLSPPAPTPLATATPSTGSWRPRPKSKTCRS